MNSKIPSVEKKIVAWLINKRYSVAGFLVMLIIFNLLPSLPYLNLFVGKSLTIFLMISSFIVFFNVDTLKTLTIISVFIVLSFGFYVIEEIEISELLGNYIFGFMFIGSIYYLLKVNKT